MIVYERWLRRCYRRLEFARFLERFARWLAVFAVVWGSVALTVKLSRPEWWPATAWSGLLFIPLTIACWWTGRRMRFHPADVAQYLDRQLGLDGLLMTLRELPDKDWERRLPQEIYQWREAIPLVVPLRFCQSQILPLMFVLAVLVIPVREAQSYQRVRNTVSQQATGRLETLVSQMNSQGIVSDDEATELLGQIARLSEQTTQGPLTRENWEVLDAVQERLDLRLASDLLTNQRALEAATTLAQSLGTAGQLPTDPQQLQQLETVLGDALQRLAVAELPPEVPPVVGQLLKSIGPDGQLELPRDPLAQLQLLGQLQGVLQQDAERLSELQQLGNAARTLMGAGGLAAGVTGLASPDAAAVLRSLTGGGTSGPQVGTSVELVPPGANRVTVAPRFGREADGAAQRFQSVVLPRRQETSGKPAVPEAEDAAGQLPATRSPEVAAEVRMERSEAREMQATDGRETWGRAVRPRHRQLLRDYFDGDSVPDSPSGQDDAPTATPND